MSVRQYTPTERLILMSLRFDPYQTAAELAESTGAGATQFSSALRLLIAERVIVTTAEGFYKLAIADDFDAIARYLSSDSAGYGELAHATDEIFSALVSHRNDRWGRAFPQGLDQVELQWATRHSMDALTGGLQEMLAAGTIVSTPTERGTRYRLSPGVQA